MALILKREVRLAKAKWKLAGTYPMQSVVLVRQFNE
jgi:hypothetical protein